jgi:dihydrofolate reductase
VPLADEMYLSTIKGDFDGDAHFLEFDANDWEITEGRDEPEFVFRRFRRVHPAA